MERGVSRLGFKAAAGGETWCGEHGGHIEHVYGVPGQAGLWDGQGLGVEFWTAHLPQFDPTLFPTPNGPC